MSYDGLMNILEMRKTRKYDTGTVRVVAKNSVGEVENTTTLTVNPLEDLRSGLRHTSKCKSAVDVPELDKSLISK